MPYALPRSFYWILFALLIVANVNVYRAIFAPPVLTISVLEVGPVGKESRATLVRSPNGKTLLIDAGPDASILRALGGALPMWQRKIDAVILTGLVARSTGGLPSLQSRYRVSKIVRVGNAITPYGSSFLFDTSRIEILAPSTFIISYGTSVFKISSSTPAGSYTPNERPVKSPQLF